MARLAPWQFPTFGVLKALCHSVLTRMVLMPEYSRIRMSIQWLLITRFSMLHQPISSHGFEHVRYTVSCQCADDLLVWPVSRLNKHPPMLRKSLFVMTSSHGNIFRVTGPLCGEFTVHRWIPLTKASNAELCCFLWSAPWVNGRINNREAGDLRRHRAHYMTSMWCAATSCTKDCCIVDN